MGKCFVGRLFLGHPTMFKFMVKAPSSKFSSKLGQWGSHFGG